jgi:hypothetical protein
VIDDHLDVYPATHRSPERSTDLRIGEVTNPQANFESRRVDRLDDRGAARLRLDEV